jgi:hypothetical protein
MTKLLGFALLALSVLGGEARAASDQVQAPVVTPVLSGAYMYNWSEYCYGALTSLSFMSGSITFNATTKTVTLNVYHTSGYPTVTLTHMTGSGTYSNTATTVTLPSSAGPVTYQATYGALLTGNVAANVSWIAAVLNGNCGDMATLTRK